MAYNEIRAMYTAYIGRVAGYARQEYLRTLSHRSQEIPLEELPEDTLSLVQDRPFPDEFEFAEDRLSQAANDLPLLRRQMLALAFVEQLSAPEIAERLGCSVNYVYKQKCLALRKMKDAMEDGNREQ